MVSNNLNAVAQQSYGTFQAPPVAARLTETSRELSSLPSSQKGSTAPSSTDRNRVLSPITRENPLEEAKQRRAQLEDEQKEREEKLKAAQKAREEQEAQAKAARKEREEQLEAEHQLKEARLTQINELQRKIDLGLLNVTKADLIAKQYQAVSSPFTLGSITSPDIAIERVDFYA